MEEKRRTVKTGALAVIGVLTVIAASLAYYLQDIAPGVEVDRGMASNLAFFLLINLNIIVVMVLVFLVVKNLIKLVLDRRRNILGARLRSRLVSAFVGLSLIPTVLLFFVAKGIIERVLEGWFSPQVEASVQGAVNVARVHYDSGEAQMYRHIRHLARRLTEIYPYLGPEGQQAGDAQAALSLLESYLQEKREEYGLFELAVVNEYGLRLAVSSSIEQKHGVVTTPAPNLAGLHEARSGIITVRPEQSINAEFLRAYAPVSAGVLSGLAGPAAQGGGEVPARYCIVAAMWVLPELGDALGTVINAYDDYKELKSYRRPLVSSYFLTLLVVTLLIVFGAIWVGFYLARELSVPIGLIAEGTQQVAHGNLHYRLPEVGDDELAVLVRDFNIMTRDLQELTEKLLAGRSYMETVLARVGVGVISIDAAQRVTTCNIAAAGILDVREPESAIGRALAELLPESLSRSLLHELHNLYGGRDTTASFNASFELHGAAKHLQITLTKMLDEKGGSMGTVVLLDNITELVSAQRMAAWREVARRIAHEIKNPLTPIQLNAERIQRRFGTAPRLEASGGGETLHAEDRALIGEAAETIIGQVKNLRVLVNEFSNFARMPKARLKPEELNRVIEETIGIYRHSHPEIEYRLHLDPLVPVFPLDREQMSRALMNLLDNAIAAVQAAVRRNASAEAVIEVKTEFDDGLGLVSISVSDTGLGIAEEDKPQLFEPYFSRKREGTGLGLAIVRTIVGDHNGFIRVRDRAPHGAVFIIELPVGRHAAARPSQAAQA